MYKCTQTHSLPINKVLQFNCTYLFLNCDNYKLLNLFFLTLRQNNKFKGLCISLCLTSKLIIITIKKNVKLTLKSWYQKKNVKGNSHVHRLKSVKHLEKGLLLTQNFLDAIVCFAVVKKNVSSLQEKLILASYSRAKAVAIWSLTTCKNCRVWLTHLSLWQTDSDVEGSWQEVMTLEKVCACNAARHNSFVTLPNQDLFSCWSVFFSHHKRKYLVRRGYSWSENVCKCHKFNFD